MLTNWPLRYFDVVFKLLLMIDGRRFFVELRLEEHRILHRISQNYSGNHDDVIKWKHLPRYWPFVREFTGHRWIPRTKTSDAELWCFLWTAAEHRLSEHSLGRWFETPSCSLWRHCNDVGVLRQQAINWANVDPNLCPLIASLCHNGLTYVVTDICVWTKLRNNKTSNTK